MNILTGGNFSISIMTCYLDSCDAVISIVPNTQTRIKSLNSFQINLLHPRFVLLPHLGCVLYRILGSELLSASLHMICLLPVLASIHLNGTSARIKLGGGGGQGRAKTTIPSPAIRTSPPSQCWPSPCWPPPRK